MTRPVRKTTIKWKEIDKSFARFFNRCAEPTKISEEEFDTYAREMFYVASYVLYGDAFLAYVLETQESSNELTRTANIS